MEILHTRPFANFYTIENTCTVSKLYEALLTQGTFCLYILLVIEIEKSLDKNYQTIMKN